jgi:hypothetical protein
VIDQRASTKELGSKDREEGRMQLGGVYPIDRTAQAAQKKSGGYVDGRRRRVFPE